MYNFHSPQFTPYESYTAGIHTVYSFHEFVAPQLLFYVVDHNVKRQSTTQLPTEIFRLVLLCSYVECVRHVLLPTLKLGEACVDLSCL